MADKAAMRPGRPEAIAEAQAARLALEATPEPTSAPRLLSEDVTAEALAQLLADQAGRFGIISSEGGVLGNLTGRYSGMSNLDVVLHAWAGEDFSVDRIGRDPVHVVAPALVLGLAVQPAVLAGVTVKHPEVRDKGLLARFLWAMPNMSQGPVRIGHRKIDPPAVPDAVPKAYRDLVYDLAVAPIPPSPRRFSLSPEAGEVFRAWRAEAEGRRRPDGDLAAIPEWAGKFDGHTLRLAALLHLAEGSGSLLIGASLTRAAIEIMRYCVPHAAAVEVLAGGRRGTGDAHALLAWIERTAVADFSLRDAQRGVWRFKSKDETKAAIDVLVDHGYARPVVPATRAPGKAGQSPSPRFEVHVDALPPGTESTEPRRNGHLGPSVDSVEAPKTATKPQGTGSVDSVEAPGASTNASDKGGATLLDEDLNGRCALCGQPVHRDGEGGNLWCADCRAGTEVRRDEGPAAEASA